MARQGIPVGAPVEYPTVVIEGVTYTLKMSLGAQVMLDKSGVSLGQLPTLLKNPYSIGSLNLMMELLRALIAHQFLEEDKPIPSVEWLSHHITSEEWKACCEAMPKAVLKVGRPAEIQLRESDANTSEMKQ